jgi:hypothetical protein
VTDEPQDASDAPEGEDEAEEGLSGGRMAQQLRRFAAHYVPAKNASGATTKICGDSLSQLLLSLEPEQVSLVAAAVLDLPADKYDHLNPGQVRMNWGNRLRAAIKKDNVSYEDVAEQVVTLSQA